MAFPEKLSKEDARRRIVIVARLFDNREIDETRAVKTIARISELAGELPEWGFVLLGEHPLAEQEFTYAMEAVN